MNGPRRGSEAAQRFAERRKREDEAQRLKVAVPRLETLRLEINEHRAGHETAEAPHIRRVVVEHAPALFILPCGDASCKNGGHDVTHAIMRELASGATQFDGEDVCMGQLGAADCQRVLHFVAFATYES